MALDELFYNLVEYVGERDPVKKIDMRVGCSHHPQAAYNVVSTNTWCESSELSIDSLKGDYYVPVLDSNYVDSMSPRARAAFETVKFNAFQVAGLAYIAGRVARNNFNADFKEGNVDELVYENASLDCASHSLLVAYQVFSPVKSILCAGAGLAIGIAMIPYSFLTGYAHNLEDEKKL